jgi:hypothetical protein
MQSKEETAVYHWHLLLDEVFILKCFLSSDIVLTK